MERLEEDFLGAAMNRPDAMVGLKVNPEHFTAGRDAIVSRMLAAEGQFTPTTLAADLAENRDFEALGGFDYLWRLFDQGQAIDQIDVLARKVTETACRNAMLLETGYFGNALRQGADLHHALAEYQGRLGLVRDILPKASRFQPVPLSGFKVDPQAWRVDGLLPVNGVGFLAGASGAGKSFVAVDLVMSLAAGLPMIWGHAATPCAACYVAPEAAAGVQMRAKAWCTEHGQPDTLPVSLIPGAVNLLDPSCVEDLAVALESVAADFADKGNRLGVTIIDTLAKSLPGGDENSGESMSLAVQALEVLAERSGSFVLAVHHYGKSGAAGDLRGWSGLRGAADAVLAVERDPEGGFDAVRTIRVSKAKDGEDGEEIRFRLRKVGLGVNNQRGHEITSCVVDVDTGDAAQDQSTGPRLSASALILLKALKAETDHGVTYGTPPGQAKRDWSQAVDLKAVSDRALRSGFAVGQAEAEQRKRLGVALEGLIVANKARLDTERGWIWLI